MRMVRSLVSAGPRVLRARGRAILPYRGMTSTGSQFANPGIGGIINGKHQAQRQETPTGDQNQEHAIASTDLLEMYRGLVAKGRIKWDDEQVRIIMRLRHLYQDLEDYSPPLDVLTKLTSYAPSAAKRASLQAKKKAKGWWDRSASASIGMGIGERELALVKVLSGEEEIRDLQTPKGVMLTGPPGTGKSMVLSLFFDSLPTSHKKRWHYHAFTLWLYRQVFVEMERRRKEARPEATTEKMEKAAKRGWKAVFAGGRWEDEDPSNPGQDKEVEAYEQVETIPFIVARRMILDYHILYFDEMQLVDATSAAILRDVLSWYWRLGGVIVTCSNRVPDDLYHHGVQKERMAGFLDSLKARCEVVELDGGRDWRGGVEGDKLADKVKWYAGDQEGFESAWADVTAGQEVAPVDLGVYGRRLHVSQASGSVCRMTFEELCEQPLGAADYITLASRFSTFFIDSVPVLYLRNKNEARRLINLIDALYESRCQIVVSSESSLDMLFFPDAVSLPPTEKESKGKPAAEYFDHGDSNESIMAAEALSETLQAAAHPNVSLYNPGERAAREKREAKEAKTAGSFGVLGIWTGEDERFAYKRAVSRMREMTTSPAYAREEWLPLSPEGRIWETPAPAVPLKAPRLAKQPQAGTEPKDPEDFAREAAYSRPNLLQQSSIPDQVEDPNSQRLHKLGSRVGAPTISEKHVWGVVDEWGEKAGKWGKGSKAFKGEDE